MINVNSLIKILDQEKNDNTDSFQRICLHDTSHLMQIMLIKIPAQDVYPFFRNKSYGNIVYHCLDGEIEISTIKNQIEKSLILRKGEIITLSKNIFRRTKNVSSQRSIYLECIDGPFYKDDKEFLQRNL